MVQTTSKEALPFCYVNGKRHLLPLGRAEATVLQFLRGTTLISSLQRHYWHPLTMRRSILSGDMQPDRRLRPCYPILSPLIFQQQHAWKLVTLGELTFNQHCDTCRVWIHWHKAGLRRRRMRGLHSDGVKLGGRCNLPPRRERLPMPLVCGGGHGCCDSGRCCHQAAVTAPLELRDHSRHSSAHKRGCAVKVSETQGMGCTRYRSGSPRLTAPSAASARRDSSCPCTPCCAPSQSRQLSTRSRKLWPAICGECSRQSCSEHLP